MSDAVLIAIITGAFSLCCAGVTAWVSIRKGNAELKQQNAELKEQVDKLVEHDEEQYLGILRLTVMSEEMPISERLIAGQKYVKKGGNGDVKKYYQKLLEEHTK